MKAKVIKLTDTDKYNFRNECVGQVYDIVKFEHDSIIGKLYTLDTTASIGCVTAWNEDFLEFQ